MPQVKGQALHVRMRDRGDPEEGNNETLTLTLIILGLHACAGAHVVKH